MSSGSEKPEGARSRLAAVLRELGVEDALAQRIRALVEPAGAAPDSSTRARPSYPMTRPSANPSDEVASLATQRARPPQRPAIFAGAEEAATLSAPSLRPPSAETPLDDGVWTRATLEPLLLLGEGGMGEVHRARDAGLGRLLAMKVLRAELSEMPRMRTRFLEEAQITAQLAHPSIPPVHALGRMEDGRPYFTMKEVHGRTLAAVIEEGFDAPGAVSEHRRLEIFQRVCEAVAYAHARGVIHCDLKPLNVMVGAFGEVLVMDWGVARLVAPVATTTAIEEPPVQTHAGPHTSWEVAGTPAYMPPEQALADVARLGPPTDVYALGVLLFELLSGERPYHGALFQLLDLSTRGVVPPIPRRPGTIVDDALHAIVVRAMRPDPAARFADAGALGEEIARWREGAMRREKAWTLVRDASERLITVSPELTRAQRLRSEAAAELAALPPEAPIEARRDAWTKEDRARTIAEEAELRIAEAEQMLDLALVHAPELEEPRLVLADLAYERHRAAERRRAWDEAARHELRLRAHDQGTYASYLAGTARLTLSTEVPCRAHLARFTLVDRLLVTEPFRDLGTTPLVAIELPIGSYLLTLEADGRPRMEMPIYLRRRHDCVFQAPATREPALLPVPMAGELDAEEVLVSAGWHCVASEEDVLFGRTDPAPRWVEGFVIRRFPVRFRELAPFLASAEGAPFRDGVLRQRLGVFHPEWPAVGVSWEGARAYAAWLSARTGKSWRLPRELEWEKAAAGADGRAFPWGDAAEPSFAHVRTAGRPPSAPERVDAFPTDRSPYGVRAMAGNVREWCADPFDETVTPPSGGRPGSGLFRRRVLRGGSFRTPLESARIATRTGLPSNEALLDVGFRLVRALGR